MTSTLEKTVINTTQIKLKKSFFFDTSILSPIAFVGKGQQLAVAVENWERFLDQMDRHHSNFADTDFTWIWTPAVFLELIGLGQIKHRLRAQISEIIPNEWRNFVSDQEIRSDVFCDHIAKRVKDFLLKYLPANKLYRQATVHFLRKHQNHRHSHLIVARIKRWAKNIRDPDHYKAFAKAIFLDTVFRYPFIDLKKIEKKDRLQAAKLWAEVMGRLTRVYFEVRSLGFDCSALGLFSEINRIGGCLNSLNPDQEKYDILMRTWDDMADTDSINFALLGKGQQPVHIVTLEKRADIERRLICLAENLREMEVRGFKTNFCPGTVTIFSPTLEQAEFFSVQEVIRQSVSS